MTYTNIPKVALERVKEYSELKRELPEFVEPRPEASWPETGHIQCEDLVIRYAVRPSLFVRYQSPSPILARASQRSSPFEL